MATTIESNEIARIEDAQKRGKQSTRLLEPVERISEIWFGLVMVLTFTCSLSVKSAGREEVRAMLLGALGCNVAWGIIDAFMYLLGSFIERGRGISALRALHSSADTKVTHRVIADVLPPIVSSALSPAEFDAIRRKLQQVPVPSLPFLTKADWLGGLGVFLLVFLSTFPVAAPFTLIGNARLALRISNGIALVMMFLTGYAFGSHANFHPWRMGFGMVLIGGLLVAATIVLGG